MKPTELAAWQQLADIAAATGNSPPTNDPSLELGGLYFDFNKQRYDDAILAALLTLADQSALKSLRSGLFAGDVINSSEGRRVLHPALRDGAPDADAKLRNAVAATQARMLEIARGLRTGARLGYSGKPIRDVVHIGIGGSHLGPELVVNALGSDTKVGLHFVANIDSNDLMSTLHRVDPETTLFNVVSKSFSTLETKVNAESARAWFVERTGAPLDKHFLAVTANDAAAREFGISESNLLPMWDWVGGRYSLWSAVGLPIAIAIGEVRFKQLLEGAREVDEHFRSAPNERNAPVLSALFGVWNTNFLGASSHAILAYDERLALLPEYLQQLEMESNGKSVTRNGEDVEYHTMPILWGGVGSRGQHAYHQLLHQGTRSFSADFISVASDETSLEDHHNWLLANALGQSEAMAEGFTPPSTEPHRRVQGNHPTTTIIMDRLGPHELGALLATYEHKVFCQGAIWDINSFDQWGVELGKELAVSIYRELATGSRTENRPLATQRLIDHLLRVRSPR